MYQFHVKDGVCWQVMRTANSQQGARLTVQLFNDAFILSYDQAARDQVVHAKNNPARDSSMLGRWLMRQASDYIWQAIRMYVY